MIVSPDYNTIEKIIAYREHCIFCQSKLKIILTNHLSFRSLPSLNSKYDRQNKKFNFILNYHSSSIDLETSGYLDATTNFLSFDSPTRRDYSQKTCFSNTNLTEDAIYVFNHLAPHVEVYCPNSKCGRKYYFSSNILRIWNGNYSLEQFPISQVFLYTECFNVDRFWIQNDLVENKTNIYSTQKLDIPPVSCQLIDFTNNQQNLLGKIKMLITFS